MPLFILAETSAGYALLKSSDKKLLQRDGYAEEMQSAEGAANMSEFTRHCHLIRAN